MTCDRHPAGGLDLGALLSQLGQVQSSLHEAQAAAASRVVEGSAGGGMVRVRLTGGFEFESVTIDPSVVDPAEVELLQDLVLAAIRDGLERANELQQQALGGTDPMGALGGIFGALGGADDDDSDYDDGDDYSDDSDDSDSDVSDDDTDDAAGH